MASRGCFYLVCTGAVETCEMSGGDNLFCQFSYNIGKDWGVVHGTESGLSQIAKRTNNSVTWNYPLEVTFKSTNVHGWPQLVVLVCGYNFWNQQVVRGYGAVHIPPTPGRHVRHIPLYTPLSSSWFMQCINWLTGNHAEFMEHNFVARSRGREVVRVRSNGFVKVVLNVMTKNMHDFGYSVDAERWQEPDSNQSQAIRLLARAPLPAAPAKEDVKHQPPAEDDRPAAPVVRKKRDMTIEEKHALLKEQQRPPSAVDFDTELRPAGAGGAAKRSAPPAPAPAPVAVGGSSAGTAGSSAAAGGGAGASGGAGGNAFGSMAGGGDDGDVTAADRKYPAKQPGSARGRVSQTQPKPDDMDYAPPSTASAVSAAAEAAAAAVAAAVAGSAVGAGAGAGAAGAGGGRLAPLQKRPFVPLGDGAGSSSGGAMAPPGAGGGRKKLEPISSGHSTPVRTNRPKSVARPAPAPASDEPYDDTPVGPDDAPRARDDSGDGNEHTPLRAKKS